MGGLYPFNPVYLQFLQGHFQEGDVEVLLDSPACVGSLEYRVVPVLQPPLPYPLPGQDVALRVFYVCVVFVGCKYFFFELILIFKQCGYVF